MKPDICIYHGNCADGFTAAWAIWKRWPDITFLPGIYGERPWIDECVGKHVLLVDFSYKRDVLEQLAQFALSVTILDHHKSAAEDLADFIVDEIQPVVQTKLHRPIIQALFDMNQSGAGLAWRYAFPNRPMPRIVTYAQDRDLWLFHQPSSADVAAVMFSFPYTFENWDIIEARLENDLAGFVAEGVPISRKHNKDIAELLKVCTRTMIIGGVEVPVANLPYTMASDAGNALSVGHPFAATYFDSATERCFSLRSQKDGGADVSAIAAAYGGGGHANASGFRMPLGWEGDTPKLAGTTKDFRAAVDGMVRNLQSAK